MKRLAFLTDNWGIKLLALVLAIVLYHAVKQSSAVGGASGASAHDKSALQHP